MRWVPFIASNFAVTSLLLSLVALLAGSGDDGLENVAILTFNTSSFGMKEYLNSSTQMSQDIGSLLPQGVTNPPSLTLYLGVKDWYSMHYLHTCSGFFAPNSDDPSLLSTRKINTTCTQQQSGYKFTLNETIRQQLKTNVQSLTDNADMNTYDTAPWIALWYIGIIFVAVEIFLFPLAWAGTRRINGYCSLVAFMSHITFNISAGLVTGAVLRARSQTGTSGILYPSAFLGHIWSIMVLTLIALLLEQLEWRFELWTFKGEQITIYRKPELKSWFIMEAMMKTPKVQGVEVGYELHEDS